MARSTLQLPAQRYRYIPENAGGVITFTDDVLTHIGTHSCFTCVGVYMPISSPQGLPAKDPRPPRAFCAHINAFVRSTSLDLAVRTGLSLEEGESIKQQTLQRLRKSASENDWDPADVDVKQTILVCPKLYDHSHDSETDGEMPKKPGWYVVDGIRDFLGRPEGLLSDSYSQGFVVNRENGEVWKIDAQLPPEYKKLGLLGLSDERFEAVEERPEEDWKVFVKRFDGPQTHADTLNGGIESD